MLPVFARYCRLTAVGGLLLTLGSCKTEPPPKPWCTCDLVVGGVATALAVYPKPLELFWYAPQQVEVFAVQRGRRELALSTEIRNDGANLGPENVRLFLLPSGAVQLELDGEEQAPACFRFADGALQLAPTSCVAERALVPCRYLGP